jgi:endonuclease YncB( thermonuclease family)
MAKPLRSQLNQFRAWVQQGRTDAWIAHQLEVTVQQIAAFKREQGLAPDEEGDGAGTSVNETLAAEGFARTLTIKPNDRYAPVFSARVQAAQAARRGLWGACRDSFG